MIQHIRSQVSEDQQNICQDQEEAQRSEQVHYQVSSWWRNQNFPLIFIQKFILRPKERKQKEHTVMRMTTR